MKIKLNVQDSNVVKQNDTYTVLDNESLGRLVVSKTILHPRKNTTGHNHVGQEEVYHFISGTGYIIVGDEHISINTGDIVLIPDSYYHQVFNTSDIEDLIFVCVFEGKRNH
tara:strand:- start:534 stop:866 length:333 start_codon:yes stop_codon:yes gene_type:complete